MQFTRGNLPSSASSNPGSLRTRSPFAMPSLSCRFCRHANPPGAKFCNECGSPLHLRPCSHCEAVTDASAGTCHQCGAAFDAEDAPSIVAVSAHAATSEARSALPETHGDRMPPAPRDSATRPRISVRSDADEDVPASSDLTRVAEPDPSTHIPEWLAERFDAANRVEIARDRTPSAESQPNASSRATSEEREEAPPRSLLAEYDAHSPRRRPSPLLAIAAVAVAAVAYYVWFDAARSVPVTTPAPAARAPTPGPAPPAARSDAAVPPTPVASPPPSLPAAAAPAGPLASTPPPRAPRVQAERATDATAAANAQARRAKSDVERSTSRATQRERERDAVETRRLIERDLGRFMTRPPERFAQ